MLTAADRLGDLTFYKTQKNQPFLVQVYWYNAIVSFYFKRIKQRANIRQNPN